MMAIKRCYQCKKITYVPFHITDVLPDGSTDSYDICAKCGQNLAPAKEKKDSTLDLSHITTPGQLLDFIAGQLKTPKSVGIPCPQCGLTSDEFDKTGKFGCPACYDHFTDKLTQLVYPYHKANSHMGKTPKSYLRQKAAEPGEKLKLLKLRLAQAIELEKYELAAEIKKELNELVPKPEASSGDQ
jgi:protein arginine kinase activator